MGNVCTSPRESANDYVLAGEAALERRNILEAKNKFNKAIAVYPVSHLLDGAVVDARRSTRHFLVTPSDGLSSTARSSTPNSVAFNPLATGPMHGEPEASMIQQYSLFDPADRVTLEHIVNLLQTRVTIATAYMTRGYWTLAEEQYLHVNQLSNVLRPNVRSYILGEKIRHMSEVSSTGMARIALAEAKACNHKQPTFGHMCRLATTHIENAKDIILGNEGVQANPRMMEVLLVEKELHQLKGEHQSALAVFQRCLGIVTACKGCRSDMRHDLLVELKDLKVRAAQEDEVPEADDGMSDDKPFADPGQLPKFEKRE